MLGVVRALIGAPPGRPDLAEETRDALAGQTEPLASADMQASGGAGAEAGDTRARGADWLWLLDGVTVPRADALEAFAAALEALERLPAPLVLAGKIVDMAGGLHPDALPRHEIFEKQLTVDACERGLVQLRAAPSGSLLVHREAFQRFGSPRTDLSPSWAAFEFTARVLQAHEDTGYLVPSSLAVRMVPPRPSGRRGGAVRARARLLPGPAWNATERLWEGFLVAEGAVKGVRGSARRA